MKILKAVGDAAEKKFDSARRLSFQLLIVSSFLRFDFRTKSNSFFIGRVFAPDIIERLFSPSVLRFRTAEN